MPRHLFALSTLILIIAGIAIQRYTGVWGKVGLP
jgi:hypothetical protein